jgi:hypothetical protein
VLATNGDVLLGEALVGLLARRELDPGAFYRIDRHDLLERFRPVFAPDATAAAERALAKVMTMQHIAVGQHLSDLGLEWDALGELHRTVHGHLRITFPDDVAVRTQYWDAVKARPSARPPVRRPLAPPLQPAAVPALPSPIWRVRLVRGEGRGVSD